MAQVLCNLVDSAAVEAVEKTDRDSVVARYKATRWLSTLSMESSENGMKSAKRDFYDFMGWYARFFAWVARI